MTLSKKFDNVKLEMLRDNDRPVHLGFTRPKLEAAFSMVREPNWKDPIYKQFDRKLRRAEALVISVAVGFFTGKDAEIEETSEGSLVVAPGYYNVIGA